LQGYLESLQLKEAELSPAERAEYIDIALRHSKRLTRLVAELFELAQLDARETRPQFEPLAPADLVMDVVQKNRLQAEQRGIQLQIGPITELPLVSADIAMIERVLENLTHNAISHTPPDGDITISLQQQQHCVIIQVQDSGSGIPADDLPHIFEPFYQANNHHRGNRPDCGAGLGLAISRRIVQLHYSELQVSSQPGQGATFSFSLPVWQQQ
jgi:signal transduction histidine kinase